jgi:bla regulator protein BlaR1
MPSAHPALNFAFDRMLQATWQAAAMTLIVLALHALLGWRIAPRWREAMWMLVFLRLVLPALPPSPMSIFNLRPPAVEVAQPTPKPQSATETITFGILSNDVRMPPSSTATATPTPSIRDLLPIIAAILWLAVAAILMARQLTATLLLARRLRSLPRSENPALIRALSAVCGQLNIRRPETIETDRVSTPALAGIVRPVLLFPASMVESLTPLELTLVLRHELAHLRRHDVLIGLIVRLIACIHWFNPLIWLAAARFRAERELACDQHVLLASCEPSDYGRTILKVLEQFPPLRTGVPGAVCVVGMLGGRRAVQRRIAAIAAGPMRGTRLLGPITLVALACALLTGPNRAAPAIEPTSSPSGDSSADAPPGTVTRVYDVRDLIIQVPDFIDAPQLGIHDAPPAATPPTTKRASGPTLALASSSTTHEKTHQQLVDEIVVRITSSVDPLSWRSNTGAVGSVRELNGQLIVTQTPANHEKIQKLLQGWRAPRAVQVTVELRFISGSKSAEELLERWNKEWTKVEQSNCEMWRSFLDPAQAKVLMSSMQSEKFSTLITAPRITLYNGQRAYVMVSRQTAFVGDLKRIGNDETDKSFEPVIKLVDSGVLFDCRAQVSADPRFVTLTISPQLATLENLTPQRWPGSAPGHEHTIQVPKLRKTTMTATVTMPDQKTAVYRFPPQQVQVEVRPGVMETRNESTLILLKPTIVIQREVEPQQFPLLPTTTRPTTAP